MKNKQKKGESSICAGLGIRPLYKEEGCRTNCPLLPVADDNYEI